MASYSAMQFFFSPLWGRLSDRHGRRPLLLISLAGSTISYAIFAYGCRLTGDTSLVILFASRIFAGIFGANITVAQAYIADISKPEERSKRMGLIGMAFGLGFIFGPALGGISLTYLGMTGPGIVASVLCGLNFIFALVRLPESRTPGSAPVSKRPGWQAAAHVLSRPYIGLLITVFFLATFAFTCFETTLPLLVRANFNLELERNAKIITFLFAYCGILGALVQGGAIGRAVKAFGEAKLIVGSLIVFAIGMCGLPFAGKWSLLLVLLGLLSIGSSLIRPPVFGLISLLTPEDQQGETLGVAQSAGSLARIFGPIFAGMTYNQNHSFPYLVCGGLSVLAAVLLVGKVGALRNAAGTRGSAPS
jgi:multidrug resistance protein